MNAKLYDNELLNMRHQLQDSEKDTLDSEELPVPNQELEAKIDLYQN